MSTSPRTLISWNVNGIRAVTKKGFLDWFEKENADVICLQEVKAFPEQVDESVKNPKGYTSFWHSAQKPGYSGVALYTRREPLNITYGIGVPAFDKEGRVLVAEFPDYVLINAYFPNSQPDHARLDYKLAFCCEMLKYCQKLRSQGKHVIVCGDYNIAHQEIDLRNPKTNQDSSGFLPQERAWLDQFVSAGYVDSFRHFEKGGGHYTWWSYRPGVRQKNIGWRIDYHFMNSEMVDRLKKALIQSEVMGSDHCPIGLVLD